MILILYIFIISVSTIYSFSTIWNGGSGDFDDGLCWKGGIVPSSTDSAVVKLLKSDILTIRRNHSLASLIFNGTGTIIFKFPNTTLKLNSFYFSGGIISQRSTLGCISCKSTLTFKKGFFSASEKRLFSVDLVNLKKLRWSSGSIVLGNSFIVNTPNSSIIADSKNLLYLTFDHSYYSFNSYPNEVLNSEINLLTTIPQAASGLKSNYRSYISIPCQKFIIVDLLLNVNRSNFSSCS